MAPVLRNIKHKKEKKWPSRALFFFSCGCSKGENDTSQVLFSCFGMSAIKKVKIRTKAAQKTIYV
jgi:hypothetical protein